MGCGASVGALRGSQKYQLGPLETPTGDKVFTKGRRSKPLLAPLDAVTDGLEKGATEDRGPSKADLDAERHARAATATGAAELPSDAPKLALQRRDTPVNPVPKTFVPVSAAILRPGLPPPLKKLPACGDFRPVATHPTLHCGVEALVERQHTAARDLQLELRGADRKVRENTDALRHLWREIHAHRTRSCAAEAEVVKVLAQLVTGEQREQFDKQRQTLQRLEQEMRVETEKGQRWLALARGLQGKADALVLEGLVAPASPAGILFSPHFMHRARCDDSESDMSPRYGSGPSHAAMGIARAA